MAYCRPKRGFTILEVAFVLAITGLMLVGILGAINNRVAAQRFNDSMQGIEEFLRSVYSEVINVENGREDIAFNQTYCTGPLQAETLQKNGSTQVIDAESGTHAGRSNCAIYGKLVTFGEGDSSVAHVYTVIGKIRASSNGETSATILDSLKDLDADVYAFNYARSLTECTVATAGSSSTYTPLWGSTLERTDNTSLLKTAVLIVRSPISGAIHTYRLKDGFTTNITDYLDDVFACGGSPVSVINTNNNIRGVNYHLKNSNFEVGDVDVCVNSPDIYAAGSTRRDLRILADGRNATAVQFVEVDSEDNRCAD